MVLGTGIDVIPIDEVRRELTQGAWTSAGGIFTDAELRECYRKRSPAPCLGACFAAKEATVKALGVTSPDLGMFREVEIVRGADGDAKVILHRRAGRRLKAMHGQRVLIAVFAHRQLAAAMAIVEG